MVYCIAKVVKFPQSATTYLYWGRAVKPVAAWPSGVDGV